MSITGTSCLWGPEKGHLCDRLVGPVGGRQDYKASFSALLFFSYFWNSDFCFGYFWFFTVFKGNLVFPVTVKTSPQVVK